MIYVFKMPQNYFAAQALYKF